MPLVINSQLPSLNRLATEGLDVLPDGQATGAKGERLNIGLLNIMPDAALEATERQIFRLVGIQAPDQLIFPYLYTFPEIKRSAKAAGHLQSYYQSFHAEKPVHLDALFITGTNLRSPGLQDQIFWQPLVRALDWAAEKVQTTFCSCLATHAVMLYMHNKERNLMPRKQWGIYEHDLTLPGHQLLQGLPARPRVPHSRHNQITSQQFTDAGLQILLDSKVAGVALATTTDGSGLILCQGHPEYDAISLLKEFKREVAAFTDGSRPDYPPVPENYFDPAACRLLDDFRLQVLTSASGVQTGPSFPEQKLQAGIINSWSETAGKLFLNWLGSSKGF